MKNRHNIRYGFALIYWLGLIIGVYSAQTSEPTNFIVDPVIPTIEIDSISYDDNLNVFRVQLEYTNQAFIGGLQVKVENERSNTLAIKRNYSVINSFDLPAEELVPGEGYIITITALEVTGEVMRLAVAQSYGNAQIQTIEAISKFEYEAIDEPLINFARIEYVEDPSQYKVMLDTQNVDEVSYYKIWYENSSGLVIGTEFEYRTPISLPLSIPIEGLSAGKYVVVIEATNHQGEVLARVQSNELIYTPPACDLICMLSNNTTAVVIVVIIVLILLFLLGYSVLQRSPKEYDLIPAYKPSNELLVNPRHIDRQQNFKQDTALRLIRVGDNTPAINIKYFPFFIGSSSENDLQIDHPEVSGRHAVIKYEGGEFKIQDLGSTNGTKLNSATRLDPARSYPLHSSAQISLSKVVYRVEILL